MNAPSDNEIVTKYVAYRDFVQKEQEALDARLKPYNDAMTMLSGTMQARLKERGDESVRTDAGTAYLSTTTSFKVANREAFMDFVREADAFEMLTAAVAKDAVKTYMEEHQNQVPPGLEQTFFTKCNFRRT